MGWELFHLSLILSIPLAGILVSLSPPALLHSVHGKKSVTIWPRDDAAFTNAKEKLAAVNKQIQNLNDMYESVGGTNVATLQSITREKLEIFGFEACHAETVANDCGKKIEALSQHTAATKTLRRFGRDSSEYTSFITTFVDSDNRSEYCKREGSGEFTEEQRGELYDAVSTLLTAKKKKQSAQKSSQSIFQELTVPLSARQQELAIDVELLGPLPKQ